MSQRDQLKAIDIAIKCIAQVRRKYYAAGEAAYQKGMDFEFAKTGHKHYEEHSQAIRQLEDLKEIITDPGVAIEQEPQQLQFGEKPNEQAT